MINSSIIELNDAVKILESNTNLKQTVLTLTKEFLNLRENFLRQFPNLSLDPQQTEETTQRFTNINDELIKQYTINQQPAITVYGPNSSGKTAFIQYFLQIGDIFPSDVGPVTTRIVKLTYASADTSYVHIYPSLEARLNNQSPSTTISLQQFFSDIEEPDWEGIAEVLKEPLTRPEDENEIEFIKWAKYFVEIGIPSSILKLGIDIYDTPGYLSNNRDEVLNENLHELIKSIKPTLLFLYENPAISETDKMCFLSLKQALESLEDIQIFFLNTKADVISIFKDERVNLKKEVPLEKFQQVLRQTREKRYKLLLAHEVIANEVIGRLPDTIDACNCFDICTVPKALTQFQNESNLMNKQTFERIIEFAVRSDGKSYEVLSEKLLSSIDEYFDIVLSTTYRNKDEWKQLHDEAINWSQRFFHQIQSTLPKIVKNIHENILTLFDQQKELIAIRAGEFIRGEDRLGLRLPPSNKRVRDFVRIAVYEEVMKVAASQAMNTSLSEIDKLVNDNLLNRKKRNELLSMAKRSIQFWEVSGEDLNRKKFFAAILEHLVKIPEKVGRFITSLRTRPYLDWYNLHSKEYGYLDALDNYANLFNESKRQEYAGELLSKIRLGIIEQKPLFEKNIIEWIQTKQDQFNSRIDQGYKYAINHMEERKEAYEITEKYSENFTILECRLIAVRDLAKFNGIKPIIDQDRLLGFGGFFHVYEGEWADQKNLAVKKQNMITLQDQPYVAYMEAHYHRAITNAHQMNIVPLLYLYYDENNQLYLFMPKYKRSLQNYLQEHIKTIEIDKILSFALIMANVLNDIHQNDFVHRDVKSSNILLDENDQCYLSDFGTVKRAAWNQSFVGTLPVPPELLANALLKQYNYSSIYNGKAVDIFAYGILLYELLPKKDYYRPNMDSAYNVDTLFTDGNLHPLPDGMTDYKQLIIDCLHKTASNRPDASQIIRRLESLIQSNEKKLCAICLEHERTVRTLPCGHKVLCQQCRDDLRQQRHNLCVICKKKMEKDISDDINQTFFLK